MTQQAVAPLEIRRLGVHALRIAWADGHLSEYPNTYLREHCPCAGCRTTTPRRTLPLASRQAPELYAVQIGVVGRYAVSMQWSDGHDTGIYSYQTLRELCPCGQCRPTPSERAGAA